jgi:hypothetical protein
VSRCMRQMLVTPDMDCFFDPRPYFFLRYLWPTNAYLYSWSCEINRLGPNEFISNDRFPYNKCNSVKYLKLLHVAFIFLFSVLWFRYNHHETCNTINTFDFVKICFFGLGLTPTITCLLLFPCGFFLHRLH